MSTDNDSVGSFSPIKNERRSIMSSQKLAALHTNPEIIRVITPMTSFSRKDQYPQINKDFIPFSRPQTTASGSIRSIGVKHYQTDKDFCITGDMLPSEFSTALSHRPIIDATAIDGKRRIVLGKIIGPDDIPFGERCPTREALPDYDVKYKAVVPKTKFGPFYKQERQDPFPVKSHFVPFPAYKTQDEDDEKSQTVPPKSAKTPKRTKLTPPVYQFKTLTHLKEVQLPLKHLSPAVIDKSIKANMFSHLLVKNPTEYPKSSY